MKIKFEAEIDTENDQDLNTIEELITLIKKNNVNYYEE